MAEVLSTTEFIRRGFADLMTFKAEVARGVVHNPEHVAKMFDVEKDYREYHGLPEGDR